jgi:hypothetical protein
VDARNDTATSSEAEKVTAPFSDSPHEDFARHMCASKSVSKSNLSSSLSLLPSFYSAFEPTGHRASRGMVGMAETIKLKSYLQLLPAAHDSPGLVGNTDVPSPLGP